MLLGDEHGASATWRPTSAATASLAGHLARIGYIASGSVALRYNRCGKTNCACHGDPPRLHGPYWHFTAKIDGKTVNKRLSDREAQLYQQWIANDRNARRCSPRCEPSPPRRRNFSSPKKHRRTRGHGHAALHLKTAGPPLRRSG